MIAKVIRRAWHHGRGHGLRARARYIGCKAVGLVADWIAGGPADAPAQMAATCRQHRRNPNTAFVHLVLSWQVDEHPTPDQAFAAARHALKRLRADAHEALIGIHRDTGNAHVHILFSRVHPITGRLLNLWNDYKSLELACREIEVMQGWAQDNGRFEAVIDTTGPKRQVILQQKEPAYWVAKKLRRIAGALPRQSDFDTARGSGQMPLHLRLPERMITRIVDVVAGASDWPTLHDGLASYGLEYRAVPRGAVIAVRGTPDAIAASHLCPDLAMGRLRDRLGPFVVACNALDILHPNEAPTLGLSGKRADEASLFMSMPWIARGARSRMHANLLEPRQLRDIITGIRFADDTVQVTLEGDGWVRYADGAITINGKGLDVQSCLAACIIAQVQGWDEIAVKGETDIAPTMAMIADAMGMKVRSLNGRPMHAKADRTALPERLLGLTAPERKALTEHAEQLQRNTAARQARKEKRDRLLRTADATEAKIAAQLDEFPIAYRWVLLKGLRHALRAASVKRTDLRPAAQPLPARDAHRITGPILSTLRRRRLRPDHPALTFTAVDHILGPMIASGNRGQAVMGDLVNLPEAMTFLAHRDEGARICGYEVALIDTKPPTLGEIYGSRMTQGLLPTGGKSPRGELHLRTLADALDYMGIAMRHQLTLVSLGQHDREPAAAITGPAEPPAIEPGQDHDR